MNGHSQLNRDLIQRRGKTPSKFSHSRLMQAEVIFLSIHGSKIFITSEECSHTDVLILALSCHRDTRLQPRRKTTGSRSVPGRGEPEWCQQDLSSSEEDSYLQGCFLSCRCKKDRRQVSLTQAQVIQVSCLKQLCDQS